MKKLANKGMFMFVEVKTEGKRTKRICPDFHKKWPPKEQTDKIGRGQKRRQSVLLTADKNYTVNIRGISQPPHVPPTLSLKNYL